MTEIDDILAEAAARRLEQARNRKPTQCPVCHSEAHHPACRLARAMKAARSPQPVDVRDYLDGAGPYPYERGDE